MSTVKALAEVLSELVGRVTLSGSGCYSATQVREGYSKRLKDIIAVESAGARLVTNDAGRAAERARQAPMTATRAQVLAEDIIAAESAAGGVKEFGLRCELRESEKRCALQLETIRELRQEITRRDELLRTDGYEDMRKHAQDLAEQLTRAHKQYEDALEVLIATHRCEVAKLKLESDRRARSVAEAIIERVVQIGITERKAIEDINIEAIVDGSKQS